MNDPALAEALRRAVLAQDFMATADGRRGGAPLQAFPSLDLAVAAFPEGGRPAFWANVLFSREFPEGLVAEIGADAGAVANIAFRADLQDAQGDSIAWLPGADWSRLDFPPLAGAGPHRFVAPFPASLLKLMVLVGVARLIDQGHAGWTESLDYQGQTRSIADWAFDMTAISCNRATSALVALLHRLGAIRRDAASGAELHNALHQLFEGLGLPSLRLAGTRPEGGWGNAAGSGVGRIQMTAWDSLRLLWLLDPAAPAAPWRPAEAAPLLSPLSRSWVLHALEQQALHEILSSGLLAGFDGHVEGLPARLPARWLRADGSARAGEREFPPDLRARPETGSLRFAHKTGTTENYASDAGIARGTGGARRHYLIALTSSLGRRYAPDPRAATTWRLPALGRAIDDYLRQRLGD
ncbi:serine hydrolase [Roseateles sp. DAIF2]|uniref:serine hydrolase n=1 Tax=Roseateles sp. DAIF2 TaxID=2714952 RepID=UPI0018A2FAAF|nr:serine hydrolase [Roseateles sp. DAIF2]QPF71786.1 serine hydrolase [Roseateles sp. DAIF2]